MARVIQGGEGAWQALSFGQVHPGTLSFIQNQIQQTSQMLTDTGREFMSFGRDMFEQMHGSAAMARARATVQMVKGAFARDEIRTLHDVEEIRQAPVVMQRYILSQIDLRRLYQDQRCYGYEETYLDAEPNAIGENHYDYRRVMNGVRQEEYDEEGEMISSLIQIFPDELHEGDRELKIDEQTHILDTWEEVRRLISWHGEDPTNPMGGKL